MSLLNLVKKNKVLFFLIALLIPSIIFLFQKGYFQSDDGEWMIIRFSSFFQALREGQFPVRFLSRLNYGYGYPVADFLYPGFMYIGVPTHLLGVNFIDTIKLIFGLSMISSGVFSFLWLKRLFNQEAAFFGSLFYVYAPYHLYDLTRRGSVGEVLALTVLPFTLWQIERESVFWTALGIAFLIISHNTLALLFIPLTVLYMGLSVYVLREKGATVKKYLAALFLGFGMSAFFTIPAIYDLKYTAFSKTSVSDWRNYFASINLVGYTTILIFLYTIYLFATKKAKIREHRLTVMMFIIGIVSLFLALPQSSILWNILPVSLIQFPFRILSLTIISGAFLVAFIISKYSKKSSLLLGIVVIIMTVVLSREYLFPTEFFNKDEGFYTTNEGTTTVKDEYMPLWVKEKPTKHFENKVELIEGSAEISNVYYNSKKVSFDVRSNFDSTVQISTVYFPGWEAKINGREILINHYNKHGLIQVDLPRGESRVEVSFSETPLRLVADILSLLSLGVLIIYAKTKHD